jgi:DNA-binding response OmpR family regulator
MAQKILVVDDNPDAVAIVKSTLESRGYRVNTAERGAAALQSVGEDRPDAILLDIMMPDMSGLEVLEKLKATPSTASIPVILLTAKTQDDDVISGYAVGAEYYITKPFTARQLMYGVNLVLGQQGERGE